MCGLFGLKRRHAWLPDSDRCRLGSDRKEHNCNIAEMDFGPTAGEWYYQTSHPDKKLRILSVQYWGTLLELVESLRTEELRCRINAPPGSQDTYCKAMREKQEEVLDHHR